MDHLIAELNDLFDKSSTFSVTITEFIQLLPSESLLEKSTIERLYRDDLPSYRGLAAELHRSWINQKLINFDSAATLTTPEKLTSHVDEEYFPNIKDAFQYYGYPANNIMPINFFSIGFNQK